ncbi:MAG: TadE/TadG family type IV pilus assembly protein [Alphaproteobacteria bacterium]
MKKLWNNNDGVTTLEFALISPAILLLMLGTVEFSLIMFTTSVMESATNNTARMGKTGYTEPGLSREEMIVQNISEKTAGLLNPTDIIIDTTVYPLFDSVGQNEPFSDTNGNQMYNVGEPYSDVNGNGQWDADMGAEGAGDANDVVVYVVSYNWPIFTPLMNGIIGNTINITVRTVVKNEPYNVTL